MTSKSQIVTLDLKMLPLSLVVLTYNEESHIARCLASVPFAQDKLVLDSGSTDRTVALAQEAGARVVVEKWQGFYHQRVRGTQLAHHDWILMLDADEALSPESQIEITALLQTMTSITSAAHTASIIPTGIPAGPDTPTQTQVSSSDQVQVSDAYAIPRISYHLGRWIHHGGWYPDWQIRLFHRQRAHWGEGHLHEKIVAPQITKLKQPMLHWVFENLSDQVETNNRYSTLGSLELLRRQRNFHLLALLFKPLGKFLETYVWKLGFLDGYPGFIISVGAAYSMFLKYAKLWEIKNIKKDSSPHPS